MTPNEMAQIMRGVMNDVCVGATFTEFQQAIGPEAYGDKTISEDGILIWFGASEAFVTAFQLVKEELIPEVAFAADSYVCDGLPVSIPVDWRPVIFNQRPITDTEQ